MQGLVFVPLCSSCWGHCYIAYVPVVGLVCAGVNTHYIMCALEGIAFKMQHGNIWDTFFAYFLKFYVRAKWISDPKLAKCCLCHMINRLQIHEEEWSNTCLHHHLIHSEYILHLIYFDQKNRRDWQISLLSIIFPV